MSERLESVCLELDFIVNDVVVSRTNCALETVVRLKEKIELCVGVSLANVGVDLCKCTLTINGRDTPIHNSSWPRVSILISELRLSRVEARMMSFSADDDRQLRSVHLLGIPESLERFDDAWEFLLDDCTELSLRDTVAVDNDSTWQHFLVFQVETQAFFHHGLQIGYHLTDYQLQ